MAHLRSHHPYDSSLDEASMSVVGVHQNSVMAASVLVDLVELMKRMLEIGVFHPVNIDAFDPIILSLRLAFLKKSLNTLLMSSLGMFHDFLKNSVMKPSGLGIYWFSSPTSL